MNNEPTIFSVDPNADARESIRNLACMMNLQCEAYASGQEFFHFYNPSRPGCLVLEVKIPDISGLEVQERLASQEPALPIIFLSGHATVSIAVRAMRAGAVHFLEKPLREDELWDVIHEALELDRDRRRVWVRHQRIENCLAQLTSKERRVLEMIAEGKTKKTIAEQLGVGVRSTEIYRAQMMKKLGFKIPDQLLHFAVVANDGHARGFL